MLLKKGEKVILNLPIRKRGIQELILTNRRLTYEKEVSTGIFSRTKETVFSVPLYKISNAWVEAGLFSSKLILEVAFSQGPEYPDELKRYEFITDKDIANTWVNSITRMVRQV